MEEERKMSRRSWGAIFGRGAILGAAVTALALAGAAAASEGDSPKPVQVAEASRQPSQDASDDSARSRGAAEHTTGAPDATVVYQPPRRGAPRAHVGAGGVRGSRAVPQPLALAPDHVGLTTSATPALYWQIDAAPGEGLAVVFTLNEEDRIEPLIEAKLATPERAGIHSVRPADYGVTLAPDVDYEWSIALVDEDGSQPQVAVSVGYLRRVARPAGLSGTPPDAAAFARAGLWYDALDALEDAITRHPGDARLREQRSSLLRQAKLEPAIE
jgi:hypothetical protein